MRQCPSCDVGLDKVTRNSEKYKTSRWYCINPDCGVIEMKFAQGVCGDFRASTVIRAAVARTIHLKGTTLKEIGDNIELEM